jgi:glycosyltransferase involved in cell wall biosynthesis
MLVKLKTQDEIIGNWIKTDMVVSICCATYNHEKFIQQTLESLLMQDTNFPFEILVHEDASTDNTKKIIEEYKTKFPDIVKPIFQSINQKSIYKSGMNPRFNYPRAIGKYIALCDGDDYWSDKYKLKKQVEFLDANPECSFVFHPSEHLDKKNGTFKQHKLDFLPNYGIVKIKNLITQGGKMIATNSILFRRELYTDIPGWALKAPVGDLPLTLVLASRGKVGYINEMMSVYRIQTDFSWTKAMTDRKKKNEHFYKIIKMWRSFNKWTKNRYCIYVQWKITKNTYYHIKGYFGYIVRKCKVKSIN